jgi:hypothetical protein
VLCIMGELQRAGVGEMYPVAAAQPANLAFEIRPLRSVASLVIDEAVPDVDVSSPPSPPAPDKARLGNSSRRSRSYR